MTLSTQPNHPDACQSGVLYGAQTALAVRNFKISDLRFPPMFIRALGLVKAGAATVNGELGELAPDVAEAIAEAAREVADGRHDDQFPVGVFETGSGTSTNMNANEGIATLATRRLGRSVHPNDDVNRGQSSNDVIPTALHISATLELRRLSGALSALCDAIRVRSDE